MLLLCLFLAGLARLVILLVVVVNAGGLYTRIIFLCSVKGVSCVCKRLSCAKWFFYQHYRSSLQVMSRGSETNTYSPGMLAAKPKQPCGAKTRA